MLPKEPTMHQDTMEQAEVVASGINDVDQSKQLDSNKVTKQKPKIPIKRKFRSRKQKRLKEVIEREISPQPDSSNEHLLELQVMKNVNAHENSTSVVENQDCELDSKLNDYIEQEGGKIVTPPKIMMANGRRLVQCNICKRFMTESRLANHIRLLHYQISFDRNDENTEKCKEFRCDNCGKSYASKYTFDQHVKTHTEGRPKCPECASTFASAFSLFRHRAKVHNIEHSYTTHNCDLCNKIFFSLSELTLHKQRHSAEKTHECPTCKKMFSAKGNLRIHMRTHAKEKLYKCDICEHTFSHPYSLVNHRRIHTNEFPYKCSECGKHYRSKHQLASHTNVHRDDRPYQCDQCTKSFRSRTAYKMHLDEHKGIKRFDCQYCGRKFQCQANKSKHERRHLGIKRHRCDKCDKAFIEKQELKNHIKVHEKTTNSKESNKTADAAAPDVVDVAVAAAVVAKPKRTGSKSRTDVKTA